ncbi:MAG: hypothetical protein COT81_02690 [Candidatus Buchananbacteria bacterium CG10_big_fil_rev_8_21_14_0_10_42_9]|uniref:Uncharacterized protein n=1 Tax=Candidatus Buchananbacteria bacterium CG10_big_fil_rev_8_21_14_0_10_42_9 TaxID=1974526 RepID=A0A2H0W3B4_9BACT|nr:MAG: hypothetical protein COT81_02690 [Candidatus Buchananbacteria bacterium CG10_big_fil_rev_8_21_14_0_10_42_9]
MGEIIQFPGGKDREKTEELKWSLDMNVLTDMLMHLAELRQSDPNSYNPKNVDIRVQGIESATSQQLCDLVNESNETDWNTHPSFYDAVIQKLKERGIIKKHS